MSVGLDIGSKTIKIVELAKEGQRFRLKASGIASHSGKRIEQAKDDKELTYVSEVIRKLHKEAGLSSKEVAIALPESQVFTKLINFPLLTDAEIASAIKWEAEQHIPIPIQEAIVQHQVIERREDLTPPRVSVLLVSAPRNLVEKYVGVVQAARLTVTTVETSLISLVRALAPKERTVLLVDFGAVSTNIAIAVKGKLSFSRSIPTAGEAFTRAVVQSFGVDYSQAEQYKTTYGLSEKQLEGKIKTALEPTVRMVVDEIKKAIHFYQSEEKGEAPSSIMLAGGTSKMPEIVSYLSEALGIEVVVGNPFANLVLETQLDQKLISLAPLYSVAVGLAKV